MGIDRKKIETAALGVCAVLLLIIVVYAIRGEIWDSGPFVVAFFSVMAVVFYFSKILKNFTFTVSVFATISLGFFFPGVFGEWIGFKFSILIVPLLQVIMFAMGTSMVKADFVRIVKMPLPVFIGIILQFSVMPFLAYSITRIMGFDGEIAVGIILVGCCSGGVASNLMVYLAKGNVTLSVTMTCFSTLLAPFITPFLTKWLAGSFIEINVFDMMMGIINIIIVPVLGGYLANMLITSKRQWTVKTGSLLALAISGIILMFVIATLPAATLGFLIKFRTGLAVDAGMIGFVALCKLVTQLRNESTQSLLARFLPVVSMVSICIILGIITAQTRDVLLTVGFILIVAALIHNSFGYLLGYWVSKGAGFGIGMVASKFNKSGEVINVISESDSRTIAFEVGMQNGGMATGLAVDVLKSTVAALPPNVFGTLMNITGSLLANYWKGSADRISHKGV